MGAHRTPSVTRMTVTRMTTGLHRRGQGAAWFTAGLMMMPAVPVWLTERHECATAGCHRQAAGLTPFSGGVVEVHCCSRCFNTDGGEHSLICNEDDDHVCRTGGCSRRVPGVHGSHACYGTRCCLQCFRSDGHSPECEAYWQAAQHSTAQLWERHAADPDGSQRSWWPGHRNGGS